MARARKKPIGDWFRSLAPTDDLLDLVNIENRLFFERLLLRWAHNPSNDALEFSEYFRLQLLNPLRCVRENARNANRPRLGALFASHANRVYHNLRHGQLKAQDVFELNESWLLFSEEIAEIFVAQDARVKRKGGKKQGIEATRQLDAKVNRVAKELHANGITSLPDSGSWIRNAAAVAHREQLSERWLRNNKTKLQQALRQLTERQPA